MTGVTTACRLLVLILIEHLARALLLGAMVVVPSALMAKLVNEEFPNVRLGI